MTMYGRTLHDDRVDGHLGRVTVQYALERSSDVGAAKMALKLGNQKFYDYMQGFGFRRPIGDRAAERDAGAVAQSEEVGCDQHSVAGDRAGDWCDAGATCNDGERDCQWRACICRRMCCCSRLIR